MEAFLAAIAKVKGNISIQWISAHSDVKGNKKADEVANEAALGKTSGQRVLLPILRRPLPISASAEKQTYLAEIKGMWDHIWQESPRRQRFKEIDPDFPFNKFRKMRNQLM
ncbi:hypothetical protein B0H34DRAFT_658504 [Crassisporium funariophilum]|nr:hypothetical protein B0H34DRAFT_658504 [Crassisporium funariophilum]